MQPCNPVAGRENQVQSELSKLENSLSRLAGAINEHENKLSPILVVEPPQTTCGPSKLDCPTPLVPLASKIANLRSMVNDSTQRLEDITRRSEV
jgi:hypothetical protein